MSQEAGNEVSELFATFDAYTGRYEVNAAQKLVRHHIFTALDPRMLGGTQDRLFNFPNADTLELQIRPYMIEGVEHMDVLSWTRQRS